jgi:hypothetical protein
MVVPFLMIMTVVVTMVIAVRAPMIFIVIGFVPVGMAQMSLAVFPVEQEMGAGDAASLLLFDVDREAGNMELGKLRAQILEGYAEIDERGEDHIAACAALHVEGEGGHGWLFSG